MLSLCIVFLSATANPATILVATHDSSDSSKSSARFVGDGEGDQEEINSAIKALPPAGGTVFLAEGTYDIRRVEGALGGVLIDRSTVILAGHGPATRLVQAPDQDTNVIRIIGSGVGDIVIRDLTVDANRSENASGTGDPNVSHARFEFCGIKAFYTHPGGPTGERNHDITIRNCTVKNAHRLGIMLEGSNMQVIDCVLGNAGSDAVEILTGPGRIAGNYVEITGQTHVAIGTDRADSVIMANNVVHVRSGGQLDIAFRSWADSNRHVIANNIVTVEKDGSCTRAVDARGYGATITGNAFQTWNVIEKIKLTVSGGDTLVSNNVLTNALIEINDVSENPRPTLVSDNIYDHSEVVVLSGQLHPDSVLPKPTSPTP